MKNSTILKILLISITLSPLFWFFTIVMLQIFIGIFLVILLIYLIFSFLDYVNDDCEFIEEKHNIFHIFGRLFKWADSKPRIIKPSKKDWRTPEDWDSEV